MSWYLGCGFAAASHLSVLCASSATSALKRFSLSGLQQDALLFLQHRHDRGTVHHAILPGGVVLELFHRELDASAPAVEDHRVGVANRELGALYPLLARKQAVDLLQVGPKILPAGLL